jgi:hypothetical protein
MVVGSSEDVSKGRKEKKEKKAVRLMAGPT